VRPEKQALRAARDRARAADDRARAARDRTRAAHDRAIAGEERAERRNPKDRTQTHERGTNGRDVLSAAQPVPVDVDASPVNGIPLAGGHLLAAISTSIVGILREHYGRGPMKAKTYAIDDIIVVVMRGSGFTALEQTIMDSGEPDRVIAMREDFQRVMAKRYKETIEELTGRKVLAFLSQAHVEPDITMEIFFVDGPLDGFGTVEITEPVG
jgi:uncharacterized protein YbcI